MICTKVELRLNWTHSSPKHQERFQCMWITPKCNVIQSRVFGLITDLCNSKVKHELTHLHQYLKRCHHHHLQLNKKRETWMQLWSVERALWVDEMLLHPPKKKEKKKRKALDSQHGQLMQMQDVEWTGQNSHQISPSGCPDQGDT